MSLLSNFSQASFYVRYCRHFSSLFHAVAMWNSLSKLQRWESMLHSLARLVCVCFERSACSYHHQLTITDAAGWLHANWDHFLFCPLCLLAKKINKRCICHKFIGSTATRANVVKTQKCVWEKNPSASACQLYSAVFSLLAELQSFKYLHAKLCVEDKGK